MKKNILTILALLICWSITTIAVAAELRGNFFAAKDTSIPKEAKIHVTCGSKTYDETIRPDGSFSVRRLPSRTGCVYRVMFSDSFKSKEIAFNSGRSVVKINAEIRKYKNLLLIIPR